MISTMKFCREARSFADSVGLEFDHEFASGLVPFGRFGYATSTGTTLRMSNGAGLADTHSFGRRGICSRPR